MIELNSKLKNVLSRKFPLLVFIILAFGFTAISVATLNKQHLTTLNQYDKATHAAEGTPLISLAEVGQETTLTPPVSDPPSTSTPPEPTRTTPMTKAKSSSRSNKPASKSSPKKSNGAQQSNSKSNESKSEQSPSLFLCLLGFCTF